MTFCEPSHPPGGVRKALRCLSLLLLPTLLAEGTTVVSRPRPVPHSFNEGEPPSVPYLVARAAPPLRFAAPPAPPPPIVTVALPPPVAPAPENSTPDSSPNPSAPVRPVRPSHVADAAAPDQPSPDSPPSSPEVPTAEPVKPAPAPILRDDITPVLHPEDVLPFFKLPGSEPDVNSPPSPAEPAAPGQLRPSTAHYTQR